MEPLMMKFEGQDLSKSDLKHGPTSNSGEKNKAGEDMDLIEIISVGNTDNGSNLEALQLLIPVEQHIDFEKKTLCVKEDLSPQLGQDLLDLPTSQDATVNDSDYYQVGQVGVHDVPRTSGDSSVPDDDLENLMEHNKGQEVEEPQASSKLLIAEDHFERECPICTELYDANNHKQSLLNCNHVFCDNCIKTMVNKANQVSLGRVTCPLCRQTTPMMEWEIRKMQEQMLDSGGIYVQQDYVIPEPIVRRPGLCGALEYRFQKRFQNGRLIGFPPCVRHPQRLVEQLNRLQHRCRCLYLCALAFLLFSELFCFFFLFLPIVIFVLLIAFGK